MEKSKKIFYLVAANFLVLIHIAVLVILLAGFMIEKPVWLYPSVLMITLGTQLATDSCVLTKWEFFFRKKIDPSLSYDASFLSWYAYKYSQVRIPSSFLRIVSYLFLSASLYIYYRYIFLAGVV
jgi:hypothetical protein